MSRTPPRRFMRRKNKNSDYKPMPNAHKRLVLTLSKEFIGNDIRKPLIIANLMNDIYKPEQIRDCYNGRKRLFIRKNGYLSNNGKKKIFSQVYKMDVNNFEDYRYFDEKFNCKKEWQSEFKNTEENLERWTPNETPEEIEKKKKADSWKHWRSHFDQAYFGVGIDLSHEEDPRSLESLISIDSDQG